MAYLIDGIAIALFALMVFLGYRKGFIRTVSGVISFVLALVLSAMLAAPVAEYVYTNSIQSSVTQILEDNLGKDSPTVEQLDEALEDMPAFISERLAISGITDGETLLNYVGHVPDGETAATEIEKTIVRSVVYPVLEAVFSLILFVVLQILLSFLLRLLNLLAKLPLIKKINKWAGLLAGAVQGVLWVLFAVSVLELLIAFDLFEALTPALVENTKLVSWLSGINPFGSLLKDILLVG